MLMPLRKTRWVLRTTSRSGAALGFAVLAEADGVVQAMEVSEAVGLLPSVTTFHPHPVRILRAFVKRNACRLQVRVPALCARAGSGLL
jgi:hypothetical protein